MNFQMFQNEDSDQRQISISNSNSNQIKPQKQEIHKTQEGLKQRLTTVQTQTRSKLKRLDLRNQFDIEQEQQKPSNISVNINNQDIDHKTALKQLKPKEDLFQNEKMPPNWKDAEKHACALTIGKQKQMFPGEKIKICLCCGKQAEKEQIQSSDKIQKFAFLGIGYPLYFQFFSFAMIVLFVIFLTSGLFNVYSNYISDDCISAQALAEQIHIKHLQFKNEEKREQEISELIKTTCLDGWITRFSLLNKRKDLELLAFQDMLNLSCLISLIIVINLCNKMQLDMIALCDDSEITAQDYTVVVTNIPRGLNIDYKKELTQHFVEMHEVQIESFNFMFNLKYYKQQYKVLNDLINQKKNILKEQDMANLANEDQGKRKKIQMKNIQVMEAINKEINAQKQLIFDIRKEYKDFQNIRFQDEFIGSCFISLKNEEQKEMILQNHELSLKEEFQKIFNVKQFNTGRNLFRGHKLKVRVAPEPSNVNWMDLNKNPNRSWTQIKFSFFYYITILIICVIVFIFIFFQQNIVVNGLNKFSEMNQDQHTNAQQKSKLEQMHFLLQLESMGISFFLVIFNSLLLRIITDNYADKMQTFTISSKKQLIILNLGCILFVNQSLMVFLAVRFGEKNFFGPGGLVYSQFYVFIFDAIQPFTNVLLDPTYKIQMLKIKYFRYNKNDKYLTQQEANDLNQKPVHDIEFQYALLLKTVFNAVFYACFLPLGIVLTLTSLTLFYFQEKYILVNKRSVIFELDEKLSQRILKLLEFVIVLNAGGTYFFQNMFDSSSYLSEASLFISFCFYILPQKAIIESFLFDVQNQPESMDYRQARDEKFTDNYVNQNPISRRYYINKRFLHGKYLSKQQPIIQQQND